MPFNLPALSYSYAALEQHLDALMMEIHHSRHHQAYVNGLNAAVSDTAYATWPVVSQLYLEQQ